MTQGFQRIVLVIITAIVYSCGYYDRELVFFDVAKDDFKWVLDVNPREKGSILFINNDSIFVNDFSGKVTKYLSETGIVVIESRQPTHSGSMLSNYGECTSTIDELSCKVKIADSTAVQNVFLKVQGINSRISHPINFIKFTNKTGKKDIILDLAFIDIYDIVQFRSTEFAILFMYNGIDEETGKYFVGLIDFKDNLTRKGDNGGDFLLKKAEKLKDKLDE